MTSDYRCITNEQIEHFLPYLRGHLRRKHPASAEPDELFSAGLEGLAEGIRRFDPGRGVPYEYWVQRYAAHYVQNRAAELRRAAAAMPGGMPPGEPADPGAGDPLGELADREEAQTALAALDERERRVVEAVYYDGLSMRAAAGRLGLKTDAVFRTHRRALKKMRAALGAEE